MTKTSSPDVLERLVSLCKRRGFIFQSSEIYGGTGSVWDYGPLGVELKKNVKDRWWHSMVRTRDDIEGLDAAILMHPRVWEASGHVSGFVDPLVECTNCKRRFRADDERIKGEPGSPDAQCPSCGMKGTLTAPRQFNLMFKTFMGPVEDTAAVVYLRPETAQGIYVNFLNVQQASRQRIPFGIAQIGKAFRNEITPGNFIFRTREFEQMEMQFFVEPGTDMKWFEYWKEQRLRWHESLGIDPQRLRFHEHSKEELAHYARAAFDIEFDFGGSLGFQEIEGVHNRGDFDLSRHQEFSGKKLDYFDQPNNRRYVPYVVETSVGADRTTLAILVNGFREEAVLELLTKGPYPPRGGGAGRGRGAHGARLSPGDRADQGRRLSAGEEGWYARDGLASRQRSARLLPGVLRRVGRDRPPLPPAGRSGNAVLHHDRRRVGERRYGHRARP